MARTFGLLGLHTVQLKSKQKEEWYHILTHINYEGTICCVGCRYGMKRECGENP